MTKSDVVIKKGLEHIWQPCSQMKDYEEFKPILVSRAYGSYLELASGGKVIDAISSWWCKSLGHNHPRLKQALVTQLDKFEHIIGAGTLNETIVELSERLANLTSSLKKVFYASDGSTAIEIALKMALHAHKIKGNSNKTSFMALSNGYHGETSGALSVSDLGKFKNMYEEMLFEVNYIPQIPYVTGINDPLWHDAGEYWRHTEIFLDKYTSKIAAIILEPIAQGAGNMRIYSKDFLYRLSNWAHANDVYIIADEIMTGMGRTGKMLACMYAEIEPDFLCLSKGLTSGFMPLSAMLTRNDIYDLFYDDRESGKAFLHSNTYFGNVLAASVALEVLKIYEEEPICKMATSLGDTMLEMMKDIENTSSYITNIRSIGAIVAADLVQENYGYEVHKNAMNLGAFIRPIGNSIYWLPPLNSSLSTIEELYVITQKALKKTFNK
jgi:adenosylmethionine-8-amino-7-oxononanoate aminotransferase